MKRALLAVLVLMVLAGGAAGGWYYLREQRLAAFAAASVTLPARTLVEIPSGTGPKKVAQLLAEAGVVTDADLLYLYMRREQLAPRLQAGEYEFTGTLTPGQALEKIVSGQVKTYRFTVPEGLRAEEILPLIAGSELKLDLRKLEQLAANKRFLAKSGVPAGSIEGFLYPDTYTFTRKATEEAVLTKMVSSALAAYRRVNSRRKQEVKLDILEAFTLASIVEKETGVPEERARIACVFHNRLKLGWKLQTDPTVIYAMRLMRGVYSKNITKKDLETRHPYNTYTETGLPPGPIASPGAAALEATLNPLDCQDLFFVSRNDGTHIFCPTLECHEAAVKEWQVRFFQKQRERGAEAD